jgi:serine/threonine protein kinase
MTKHLTDEVPSPKEKNPELSEDVCRVIRKMMAKNPRNRYQTPQELMDDLKQVINGREPVLASKYIKAIQSQKLQTDKISKSHAKPGKFLTWVNMNARMITIGIGVLIVLVIIIIILTQSSNKNSYVKDETSVSESLKTADDWKAKGLLQQMNIFIFKSEWWEALDTIEQLNGLKNASLVKKRRNEISENINYCTNEAEKIISHLDALWNDMARLERQNNWAEALKTANQIDEIYKQYDASFEKYGIIKDFKAKKSALKTTVERLSEKAGATKK